MTLDRIVTKIGRAIARVMKEGRQRPGPGGRVVAWVVVDVKENGETSGDFMVGSTPSMPTEQLKGLFEWVARGMANEPVFARRENFGGGPPPTVQ